MNNELRKILGIFIFVFIAMPTLFATIWTAGVLQGVVSTNVLSDTPKEVVKQIPSLVDETFEELKKPDSINDDNTRLWVDAAAKAKTTPSQILEKTGLYTWMNTELLNNFGEIDRMLKGEIPFRDMQLDMKPVKNAMISEEFSNYAKEVIQYLPNCTNSQIETWKAELKNRDSAENLPACNPGNEVVTELLADIKTVSAEIPDKTPLNDGSTYTPVTFNVYELGKSASQFIFIFPAIFLILGALIFSTSNILRLQSLGIATGLTGLGALVIANITKQVTNFSFYKNDNLWQFSGNEKFSAEFNQFIVAKFNTLVQPFVNNIFDPVIYISNIVIVVGVVIFALSFLVTKPPVYQRQAVQPEKTPVSEVEETTPKKK